MTDEPERIVSFEHPVDDITELENERHIALAFREKNLDEKSLGDKTKSVKATDLVHGFSLYVLDRVANPGLDAENLSYGILNQVGIDRKIVNAIVLREAHNITFSRMKECLENNPAIAQKIGYGPNEPIHEGNSINQKACKLEKHQVPGSQEKTYRDLLENVATRIVWGAVRCGIVLPERTVEKYDIKLSYDKAITQLDRRTERAGLHNTVKYLLDETSPPFKFYRGSNASYEYERYISVFANAASNNIGLSDAYKSLSSSVDLDAPTNILPNIRKEAEKERQVKDTGPTSIEAQFHEAFLNMMELVNDLGIINDGQTVAQDPTLIKSELEDSPLTIGSGNTQVWYYPISAGVGTHFRLALNLDLFDSKGQTHHKFEDRLATIDEKIGVKNLCLDGEYASGDVVKACKNIVSEHWLISTGHNSEWDGFPSKEELPTPGDSPRWYDVSVGERDANLVSLYRYGENPERKLFLTNFPEDETTKSDILELADRRQAIETTISEVKEFIPHIEAEERKLKYYVMGMAAYLYNIYVLTKMVYTPKYQLELNPTKKQVLTAIEEVCGGDYPKYNDGV